MTRTTDCESNWNAALIQIYAVFTRVLGRALTQEEDEAHLPSETHREAEAA